MGASTEAQSVDGLNDDTAPSGLLMDQYLAGHIPGYHD